MTTLFPNPAFHNHQPGCHPPLTLLPTPAIASNPEAYFTLACHLLPSLLYLSHTPPHTSPFTLHFILLPNSPSYLTYLPASHPMTSPCWVPHPVPGTGGKLPQLHQSLPVTLSCSWSPLGPSCSLGNCSSVPDSAQSLLSLRTASLARYIYFFPSTLPGLSHYHLGKGKVLSQHSNSWHPAALWWLMVTSGGGWLLLVVVVEGGWWWRLSSSGLIFVMVEDWVPPGVKLLHLNKKPTHGILGKYFTRHC